MSKVQFQNKTGIRPRKSILIWVNHNNPNEHQRDCRIICIKTIYHGRGGKFIKKLSLKKAKKIGKAKRILYIEIKQYILMQCTRLNSRR